MRPKHRRLEAVTTPTAPGDAAASPQGRLAGGTIIFRGEDGRRRIAEPPPLAATRRRFHAPAALP